MSIGYNKYLKKYNYTVRKNRYKKILNHLKSEEIDNKIKYLDEKMTTSGMYLNYGLDSGTPAVPEVPAIPAVPPTYDTVTGGLSNPNDFVWPDQGDGSNPDAPTNIPSNLYTTYNGQQVAALRQIEGDYGNDIPLGYVVGHSWISTYPVGYLAGDGPHFIASAGVYGNYSTELGRKYQEAFNNWPYPGKIEKTIYFWGPLDCLFGTCRGAGQYYPAGRTNETTPKADRALYSYTLWLPADAQGNPLPNRIMTNAGSPEVPAVPGVPAVPPKQIILNRYGLGDPNFFPGFIRLIGDVLGLGSVAVEAIKSYTSQVVNSLSDALGIAATRLSTYATAAPTFIAHLAQQQGLVNYTENNPFKVWLPPQESANVSRELNNVLQTIPRERWENLSGADMDKINAVMKPPGQSFTPYGYTFYNIGNPQAFSGKIKTDPNTGLSYVSGIQDNYIFTNDLDAAGVPGAKELLNQSMTANNAQQRPDMQSSSYTYTPGVNTTELKQKNTPIAVDLPPPQLTQNSFNSLSPSVQKQIMNTMKQNYLKQYDGSNYQGKELQYMRDRSQETKAEVDKNTQFKGGYMIQTSRSATGRVITTRTPLFKESVGYQEKFLKENIDIESLKLKLREVDFLRHYKVSEEERNELENIIDKINLIMHENPEHLEYLRKRYPKDDVRLAELNYKMDQMMSASDEYIHTHFPENQKLFKKLQQSIKRNIELTDPKTFKNVEDIPSFKKLLSVDYVNQVDIPKKKIKIKNKNKKTAARFLKKPKVKTNSELIDEKINQLNKDLKKTGIMKD